MLSDQNSEDLLAFFSEWTEGRLSEDQEEKLAELLRHSEAARSLYVQYRSLEAKLYRRFGRFDFRTEEETSATPTSSAAPICDLTELDPNQIWGIDSSSMQEGSEDGNSNSPFLGFLGDIFKGGASFINKHMTLLIVLLPILAIATVAWMTPTLWQAPQESWSIVARVQQTSDCQWQEGCKKFENGDFLSTDQPLSLERGVVELEFQSGARVILQGPTHFTATGKNRGHLDLGRLAATVPKRAKGFLVETPEINVTDLGTEFGIVVDNKHNSDVHVFKGEVSIKTNPAHGASQETLLVENEAIRFDAQTGSVVEKSVDPRQFVCSMNQLSRPLQFDIKNHIAFSSPERHRFFQTRAAVLPHAVGDVPQMMILTQKYGKDLPQNYHRPCQAFSSDLGITWTTPKPFPSLKREKINAQGDEQVIGNVWPKLHKASGVVLGTGKVHTFCQGNPRESMPEKNQVSYSVYNHQEGKWSGLHFVKMPKKDHHGSLMTEPNAGCTQRIDLPDGDVLLPIRYRRGDAKEEIYTITVVRCGFDGKTLTYKEHGTELSVKTGRGLHDPSLSHFKGRYYLTLRSEDAAYVAQSSDGLNYEPARKWTYDDGKVLGSYDTQQHWVTHSDGLYLVYTRRGANNDHIPRHRAPLFIAKLDPQRLCLIRSTERILIPENNAGLGNFGVVDVTPFESWVVVTETFKTDEGVTRPVRTIIAKICWSKPNMMVDP